MIKLVTLAAGGRVRMKLRLAGTMNRWNVEHLFLFRLDRPFFFPAAGLIPETFLS
jgi:hypothetical protein